MIDVNQCPEESEGRLADIQASVHRIEGTVGAMQSRQDRTDSRMTELERDIIEVKAEQRGAEKVMTSEHARLHEKMDGITGRQDTMFSAFQAHLQQDGQNQQKIISSQRDILLWLGGLIVSGFGVVFWFLLQKHMS